MSSKYNSRHRSPPHTVRHISATWYFVCHSRTSSSLIIPPCPANAGMPWLVPPPMASARTESATCTALPTAPLRSATTACARRSVPQPSGAASNAPAAASRPPATATAGAGPTRRATTTSVARLKSQAAASCSAKSCNDPAVHGTRARPARAPKPPTWCVEKSASQALIAATASRCCRRSQKLSCGSQSQVSFDVVAASKSPHSSP
mmetsp:Transcript_34416/g.99166  ORF Transcript_34416/g.99166 Transcript_34416/m.99166 type:complete len:206 (-) Transcript_34416:174-791(-)